ncbi:hypothetical protein LTS08_003923 [Lithohypha guttulata]|nr:hypothetical protein LTS08_003923 [Lithohypha guttulata]
MPKTLNGLCNASRSRLVKRSSAHVWISDDLLSETFDAFTRSQRRHGSNVPGPLEARRRAAKRKATSSAHTPCTGQAFDPATLITTQPQRGWWTSQEDKAGPPQPGWGWSFGLLSHKPLPKVETVQKQEQLIYEDTAFSVSGLSKGQRLLYEDRLHSTRTHEELVLLLDELKIDLIHNQDLARKQLEYVLAENWHVDEIAKFLLDPRTNPPGAQNHGRIFESLANSSVLDVLLQRKTFVKATQLGLIVVPDLKTILISALKLESSMFGEAQDPALFCNDLLDMVEESRILALEDLGRPFLAALAIQVTGSVFYPSTPRLLHRLNGNNQLGTLGDSLRMINNKNVHMLTHLVDFALAQERKWLYRDVVNTTIRLMAIPQIPKDKRMSHREHRADNLYRRNLVDKACGPQELSGRVPLVVQCAPSASDHSTRLSRHARLAANHNTLAELQREPFAIETWYAFLSALGSRETRDTTLSMQVVNSFLTGKEGREDPRRRLVICLWIVMALSVRNDRPLANINFDQIGQKLCQRFSDESQKRQQDLLSSILDIIRTTPLAAKNKFLRRLHTFSGGHLNVKVSYWDLCEQLDELNNLNLSKLRDARFYRAASHHFPEILRRTSQSFNEDMAAFQRGSLTLINETQGLVSELLKRLLWHNDELKFALRHAANLMTWDGTQWLPSKIAQETHALGGFSYLQLVEMINKFAWACATTRHLSDRNALRHTHWLMEYLHQHRAPVTRDMLKALWHAGVIRNPNQSYAMVKQLYSLVVEYAGQDVAQQLLKKAASVRPELRSGATIWDDEKSKGFTEFSPLVREVKDYSLKKAGLPVHVS